MGRSNYWFLWCFRATKTSVLPSKALPPSHKKCFLSLGKAIKRSFFHCFLLLKNSSQISIWPKTSVCSQIATFSSIALQFKQQLTLIKTIRLRALLVFFIIMYYLIFISFGINVGNP